VTRLSLAQRILALDAALEQIPHAFGGALALAYYAEPRATVDIDVNLFVTTDRFPEVAGRLIALGVDADDPAVGQIVRRDGQARLMWDATPIDLFFAYDAFHEAAARAIRAVPFADSMIPILGPEHLVVCKAMYSRPQDWVDIDAILSTDTVLDLAEVLRWVARIAGDTDPRYERIAAVLTTR
jgi:hypothetical protein